MVEQDARTSWASRRELAQDLLEVVGALEVLDRNTLDAQVVAPHLLDQLGVVPALDEDAAGAGDTGAGALDVDRAGGAAGGRLRRHGGEGQQHRAVIVKEHLVPRKLLHGAVGVA